MVCALFEILALKMSSKIFNPAIVIMAKVPREESVKTRLRFVLSGKQRVELAVCFLKDAYKKVKKITPNVIVAFTPADGRKEIENLLSENTILIEQKGNDLGERMNSAFEFAQSKNFSPVIIIGTDSPDLPPEFIDQAIGFFENDETKIVIGAANDGGYYLIGLRNPANGIFENVEWSCADTFAQTAENARRIFDCEPVETPVWYDVDTPEDLEILVENFRNNVKFSEIAPATAEWLRKETPSK